MVRKPALPLYDLGNESIGDHARLKIRHHSQHGYPFARLPITYAVLHLGSIHPQLQSILIGLQEDEVRENIVRALYLLGKE